MKRTTLIEITICAAVIAMLITLTFKRNEVWQTGLGLWRDSAAKSPGKTRPRSNVAVELIQAGRYEEAIVELKALLAVNPKTPEALNNLATIYTGQGKYDEALHYLFGAIKACDGSKHDITKASVHNNIGVVLVKKGAFGEAIFHFEEALKLMSNFPQARENLKTIKDALADIRK